MTAVKQPDFIIIGDYLEGEKFSDVKRESLGGTVHAMAGAKNQHNTIVGNTFALLHGQLRGKSCHSFNRDTKVRIEVSDHTRLYYPDAMVVCDFRSATDHFQDRPVVIVEGLRDCTRRTDLGEKRDAYLTISSPKVQLFVEPDSSLVIAYRRKSEGGFSAEQYSGPDAIIPLQEIEASLPLADLYERVELKA